MKAKGRRVGLIFLGMLALVALGLAGLTWRQVRQEPLNQALIAAAKRADDKAALRLLEQGADPNCRERTTVSVSPWRMLLDLLQGRRAKNDWDAMTPLAYASGGHLVHVIKHTPAQAARTIAYPAGGGRAAPTSLSERHRSRQAAVQSARLRITVTYAATKVGKVEYDYPPDPENTTLVRVLLAHGAQVNAFAGHLSRYVVGFVAPVDYATALDYAVSYHRRLTAQMLLAHGARVIDGPRSGYLVDGTSDDPALLAVLLAHGADINARLQFPDEGMTPLMVNCKFSHVNKVKVLLANHADVNLKDKDYDTALDLANQSLWNIEHDPSLNEQVLRVREIIRLLKVAGAKP